MIISIKRWVWMYDSGKSYWNQTTFKDRLQFHMPRHRKNMGSEPADGNSPLHVHVSNKYICRKRTGPLLINLTCVIQDEGEVHVGTDKHQLDNWQTIRPQLPKLFLFLVLTLGVSFSLPSYLKTKTTACYVIIDMLEYYVLCCPIVLFSSLRIIFPVLLSFIVFLFISLVVIWLFIVLESLSLQKKKNLSSGLWLPNVRLLKHNNELKSCNAKKLRIISEWGTRLS